MKNLSQDFGRIALGGVVGSEREIKRVGETSQQTKRNAFYGKGTNFNRPSWGERIKKMENGEVSTLIAKDILVWTS